MARISAEALAAWSADQDAAAACLVDEVPPWVEDPGRAAAIDAAVELMVSSASDDFLMEAARVQALQADTAVLQAAGVDEAREPAEPTDEAREPADDVVEPSAPTVGVAGAAAGPAGSAVPATMDEWLAGLAAGVPCLGLLEAIDPVGLSEAARVDYLVALQRVIARAYGAQARVLSAMDRDDPGGDGFAQETVGCALRLAGSTAQTRLKAARALTDDLPGSLAMLEAGVLCPQQALAIARSSWELTTPEQCVELERRVLGRAGEQNSTEFGRSLRRAVLWIDPSTARQRVEKATEERRVEKYILDDGMAELRHVAPAGQIQAVWTRLDAARRLLRAGDGRTVDQQRSDLLLDAILAGLPLDGLPAEQGLRPTVQVLVGLDTLLGLNEHPGDLGGYGAITADVARKMAADPSGTWTRMITDPVSGGLLDYGRSTYRPPANLRDFILLRDGVCCYPGCNRVAVRCDYEHCQPFGDGPGQGGATSTANNAACCRRHHHCKTTGGWRYAINSDGSFTWTSPTAHTYTARPPRRWHHPDDDRPLDPPGNDQSDGDQPGGGRPDRDHDDGDLPVDTRTARDRFGDDPAPDNTRIPRAAFRDGPRAELPRAELPPDERDSDDPPF